MKSLNLKLVLSAVGIVAMLSGPAFAKSQPRVLRDSQASASQTIPGYNANGATVAIPNPDQR